MAGNKNLHRANREKNDEFYTRLVDIENELRHYTHNTSKTKLFSATVTILKKVIFSAISH
ncbi:adenine-specific methyltransferase EcoRI family protein [Glaesserella parasuis]|uniref:adenine-specific methyltransferase EcoRI family protein n=1 Tax=Glaesserella parasuis TaxID=738 RepID=UPI003CEE907C